MSFTKFFNTSQCQPPGKPQLSENETNNLTYKKKVQEFKSVVQMTKTRSVLAQRLPATTKALFGDSLVPTD